MKKFFLTVFLLLTFLLVGCVSQAVSNGETYAEAAQAGKDDLKISMLTVGHGDAILIQTSKQTILVDTARLENHAALIKHLEKLSVTRIDKIILTHPHSDHIGGAKMLINPSEKDFADYPYLKKISVAEVYDNGVISASPLYKSYLEAVKAKGTVHRSLKAGDTLNFGGGVKFHVLFPTSEFVTTVNNMKIEKKPKEYNVNNGSIVGKLTYKKFSMMFTGDCEKESEAKILANNNVNDLKCDVLKSGHHGNDTSSTKNFVKAVNPVYVLISASNKRKNGVAVGCPKLKPLENYLAEGVDKNHIFCTRWNGNITVFSNGENFSVTPERKEDWVDKWIAQKKQEKKK